MYCFSWTDDAKTKKNLTGKSGFFESILICKAESYQF